MAPHPRSSHRVLGKLALASLCSATIATALWGASRTATPLGPEGRHYLCYTIGRVDRRASFVPEGEVRLTDQFTTAPTRLAKPTRLCAPVDKDGEDGSALLDPIHLLDYPLRTPRKGCGIDAAPEKVGFPCRREEDCGGIRGVTDLCRRLTRERDRFVFLTNQFGNLLVKTRPARKLLVPSTKGFGAPPPPPDPNDPAVDHFKCYKVVASRGLPLGFPEDFPPEFPENDVLVRLRDQFHPEPALYFLQAPTHLCNPVDKNEEGIARRERHLVCYKVRLVPRVCSAASSRPGVACRREVDCGGQPGATRFCVRQAAPPSADVHVANQIGTGSLRRRMARELCVPSFKTLPVVTSPESPPPPPPPGDPCGLTFPECNGFCPPGTECQPADVRDVPVCLCLPGIALPPSPTATMPPSPGATATPTPSASASATATPSLTPSSEPSPTSSATPTPSPAPSPSPTCSVGDYAAVHGASFSATANGCGIVSFGIQSLGVCPLVVLGFGTNGNVPFPLRAGASNVVEASGLVIFGAPNHACDLTLSLTPSPTIGLFCSNDQGGTCSASYVGAG